MTAKAAAPNEGHSTIALEAPVAQRREGGNFKAVVVIAVIADVENIIFFRFF